jgi:hypothetical protein
MNLMQISPRVFLGWAEIIKWPICYAGYISSSYVQLCGFWEELKQDKVLQLFNELTRLYVRYTEILARLWNFGFKNDKVVVSAISVT